MIGVRGNSLCSKVMNSEPTKFPLFLLKILGFKPRRKELNGSFCLLIVLMMSLQGCTAFQLYKTLYRYLYLTGVQDWTSEVSAYFLLSNMSNGLSSCRSIIIGHLEKLVTGCPIKTWGRLAKSAGQQILGHVAERCVMCKSATGSVLSL